MSRVSILIPTYNRAEFIGRTIESVLAQTYKDFEIIVIDDGSTDNTKEVLKRYEKYINYVYQENGGSSSARNRGLSVASGEYIAFLDSDDTWASDKLAIQVDIMDRHKNIGLTCSRMIIFNEKGDQCGTKPAGRIVRSFDEMIRIGGDLPNSSVLTRRECFEKAGYFDPELLTMQDFDMWLRIAEHYDIYPYEKKSLAQYYRHENQNTSNLANVHLGQVILNKKILRNYKHLPEFPVRRYVKVIARNQYWRSKVYYDEKLYGLALKNLLIAFGIYPLMIFLFIEDKDTLLEKFIKMIKPYGYVVVCLLKWMIQKLSGLFKRSGLDENQED